jgi:hypothetical protein
MAKMKLKSENQPRQLRDHPSRKYRCLSSRGGNLSSEEMSIKTSGNRGRMRMSITSFHASLGNRRPEVIVSSSELFSSTLLPLDSWMWTGWSRLIRLATLSICPLTCWTAVFSAVVSASGGMMSSLCELGAKILPSYGRNGTWAEKRRWL